MRNEKGINLRVRSGFFELLRCGLWDRGPDVPAIQGLEPSDWLTLYRLSVLHTVEGVVWDGIQLLPDELLPPRDILLKWMVRQQQIEGRNVWMNRRLVDQVAFFKVHDLEPLLQKGQGVAYYYDRPGSRCCGDIDWYFVSKQDYTRAAQLGKEYGENFTYDQDYSLSYRWKNCEIEHHQRLIDLRNPFIRGRLKELADLKKYPAVALNINGSMVSTPHPISNIILVNAHILKHLVGYGIGMRQLCDSARLYHALFQQFDGEELREIYLRLGILRWIYVLHEVLVKYIGLERQRLPFHQTDEKAADWMMADILKGGNFGLYDTEHWSEMSQLDKLRRFKKLSGRIFRYMRLAPMEAIAFPFLLLFSKIDR